MDSEKPPPPQDPVREAGRLLGYAIACALVPLTLAILLCAGWWWSRNLAFAMGGVLLLLAGIIAFLYGLYLVHRARRLSRSSPAYPDEGFQRKLTWAVFLLFGNFPAAAACIFFAGHFTGSVILVRNHTSSALRQVEISDPYSSTSISLADLQPGEVRRIPRFHPGDRPAHFKAVLKGQPIEAELYSFDSGTGRFETTILPDGKIEHDP